MMNANECRIMVSSREKELIEKYRTLNGFRKLKLEWYIRLNAFKCYIFDIIGFKK